MITLEIKEYCNDCRAFEPVVQNSYSPDMTHVDKIIRCENAKKCEIMMRYLYKQVQKGVNQNEDQQVNPSGK